MIPETFPRSSAVSPIEAFAALLLLLLLWRGRRCGFGFGFKVEGWGYSIVREGIPVKWRRRRRRRRGVILIIVVVVADVVSTCWIGKGRSDFVILQSGRDEETAFSSRRGRHRHRRGSIAAIDEAIQTIIDVETVISPVGVNGRMSLDPPFVERRSRRRRRRSGRPIGNGRGEDNVGRRGGIVVVARVDVDLDVDETVSQFRVVHFISFYNL